MKFFGITLLIFIVSLAIGQVEGACPAAIPEAAPLPPNFCAFVYSQALKSPRGLHVAPNGDLLAVDANSGTIYALWEQSGAVSTAQLAKMSGLNHGLKYYAGYIYASSATTIYRWPYPSSQYRAPLGNAETVVTGMPDGGHSTRTLEFDSLGRIYVSIGSGSNLDANSIRSRVVRFTLTGTLPLSFPAAAEVFADGTRNEVGLRIDPRGRLWGVENGMDNLGAGEGTRTDFGDIHNDNPGEEVNLFLEQDKSKYYGYPFCFSEGPSSAFNYTKGFAQGLGRGTQWATYANNQWTDQTCRNSSVVSPKWVMQAHSAPLDIYFYTENTFPGFQNKVAFVAQHGSWNRAPAVPRKIVKLNLDQNGIPISEEDFFYPLSNPAWSVRPVSLAVTTCSSYGQCLFFSDDSGGRIFAIGYDTGSSQPPSPTTPAPFPTSGSQNATQTLVLGQSTLTYSLNHDSITISLTQVANGWLALGFNNQPGMIGTQCVIGWKENGTVSSFGRFFVNSYDEKSIWATFNNDTLIPWNISGASYTEENGQSTITFTRPLTGGNAINVNGEATWIIVAWHGYQPLNSATESLPNHTGRGTFAVNFLNGSIHTAPSPTSSPTPSPTPSPTSPTTPSSSATCIVTVKHSINMTCTASSFRMQSIGVTTQTSTESTCQMSIPIDDGPLLINFKYVYSSERSNIVLMMEMNKKSVVSWVSSGFYMDIARGGLFDWSLSNGVLVRQDTFVYCY